MSVGMEGLNRVSALGLPYLESRAVEAILEAHGLEGSDEYERRLVDAEECLRAAREAHRGKGGVLRLTGPAPVVTRHVEIMTPGPASVLKRVKRSPTRSPKERPVTRPFASFEAAVKTAAAKGGRWRACEKCWAVMGVNCFRKGSKTCRPCCGERVPGGRVPGGSGNTLEKRPAAKVASKKAGAPAGKTFGPGRIEVKRKMCADCEKLLPLELFPRGGRLCEDCDLK